ncbi:nucleotidyl transferase AbiEii/AbiGii toxin family protein [Phytoactinopolyspora alkaliphila]|uniref:nucleotidyl transferase AbiEii/AbiGii toxin family protein n=1 Tax=Phytoactinopolyspora alkaliphila TaxID=1783498 RepID=UPI0031B5A445
MTGLAGFFLAKCAAVHGRREPKDWYDIAFMLLHDQYGGPAAAELVNTRFAADLKGEVTTALRDLAANFAVPAAQGPSAYVDQLLVDHPDFDADVATADAMTAVQKFCRNLGVN